MSGLTLAFPEFLNYTKREYDFADEHLYSNPATNVTLDTQNIPKVHSYSISDLVEECLKTIQNIGISIKNEKEIIDYLSHYNGILDLIKLTCIDAAKRYGVKSHLTLEMYQDMEIEDKFPVLYIRQKEYDIGLYSDIKKFRNAYNVQFQEKEGYFLITTDFKKPFD